MKNKLKDYVFKIDNFLNKKICEKTILELKKIKWFDHQFYQEGGVKKHNLNDGELDVSCEHVSTKLEIKGIPTLSIIGTLNDNYTGGELIFFDDTHIKLKAGELVIFPSNFLYPHKIKPVKQGTRYSYVSWVF